jgi:tetratricopeptide (TPR) repeat protein
MRLRALSLPQITPTTLYLAALVLLGLLLRVWFISLSDLDPRFSASDDGDYYQRALRLATTGEYLDNSWLIRPPGHIFFFAAMLRLALALGDPSLGVALIRSLQVALSLLLIPVGYDMARRLFARPAALIFATIMALWLPMVELPALVLSEPLFFSLLVLSCWALVRWRDSRHWAWLAGAGAALGMAALARSPALYAAAFVMLFLLWETQQKDAGRRMKDEDRTNQEHNNASASFMFRPASFLLAALIFMLPMLAVVGPWSLRNYVVYGQLILVDNTGPVNLWLALQDQRIDGGKTILAGMGQLERHEFVRSETRRILSADPWRLTRNFWPHFTHIWKAQFIEDFFVKVSFFVRPLRELWPLGLLSDLIWLSFSLASLLALSARPREGGFRLIALGWIAYSCLTVMLIHVEPRYLLPLWLFMALYGAAALGALASWLALRRRDRAAARNTARNYLRSPWGIAGVTLAVTLLLLIVSYRDYPRIISTGLQREWHRASGARAHAGGDYPTAIAAYERMLAVAPDFVDGRTELARIYLELGLYDQGWATVGERHTHRSDLVRGALARAQGNRELAVAYFEDAELRAGEDIQRLAMAWLKPAPLRALRLGDGLDFGYLNGFSFGERLPGEGATPPRSFRWLQGQGRIRLPLAEPLPTGAVVSLRMAGSGPGETPLSVQIGALHATLAVRGGEWRVYRISIPSELAGAEQLELSLAAPSFIPIQRDQASSDARLLSVMVSNVAVE